MQYHAIILDTYSIPCHNGIITMHLNFLKCVQTRNEDFLPFNTFFYLAILAPPLDLNPEDYQFPHLSRSLRELRRAPYRWETANIDN